MAWLQLTQENQLEALIEESKNFAVLIFKHSTSCPISHAAKMRLDDQLSFLNESFKLYYLDLLSFRSVSNLVSERLNVHHESPQVILLKNGEVIYDESHLDIQVQELLDQVS